MPSSTLLQRYSGCLFPALVFIFPFYLQYSVAFFGLDLHHDLLMFDAARNFYSGQIPYKDFFYQYNLGTLFLHGAALGVLGLKIISIKKITVLFYALIALCIYLSCAVEGYKRSGFLISILWALLSPFYMLAMNGYHPWSTVFMMFACMAGLFCLQLASRKNPFFFSLIAGVFFSLSFWFKQVAAYQIVAVIIWLLLSIWLSLSNKDDSHKYVKIFFGYAVGGLITAAPFFVYLYIESAILDWWTDAFEFNKYFSKDSQNKSGIGATLEIFFPISRDIGYRSIFWGLSPLVLCIVAIQIFLYRVNAFSLSKSHKETLTLFISAGFAGWLEYFPLPNPFHTQLFMSPTFVVVGLLLGAHPKAYRDLKIHFFNYIYIYLFIVCAGYESIRHIDGWNKKRSFFNNEAIQINLDSTFDGLKIDANAAKVLTQFYRKLMELRSSSKSGEFIPLSVDPIRGLLPGKADQLSRFKMGVNWTWPNELIEPGFSNRINNEMRQRSQPIYADSLIYIPGYLPAALLEMRSPITDAHTLYSPAPIGSKLISRDMSKSSIFFAGSHDFDYKSRSILFPFTASNDGINLLPMNELSGDELESIKNIHISLVNQNDLPRILSSLQLAYLKINDKFYEGSLSALYDLDVNGRGIIAKDLNCEDKKNMAYFMLTQGKLFESQNRPIYSSTHASSEPNRPFLSMEIENNPNLHYFWKKDGPKVKIKYSIEQKKTSHIYLSFKSMLTKGVDTYAVVQIEMKDGGAKHYFYSFCDPINSK